MQVLDPEGRYKRLTGYTPEDLYNWRLERGWTLGLRSELRVFQAAIRLGSPLIERRLRQFWASRPAPDIVVSLVPNFNKVMRQSLAYAHPGVPFVTVMTDMADLPPRFWIEPGLDQHLVCGTQRAVEQARAAGHREDHIHRSSGMIIRPDFYRRVAANRSAELQALGLDPSRPTALVMFGGYGSAQMLRIAHELTDVQLILMCGHNRTLETALRTLKRAAPHAALGFTRDVPRFMSISDCFIGKPGPGALSEALHCGLPLITFRNAWTMPQERYNTEWVEEQGVGRVVASVRELPDALQELITNLPRYREAVDRVSNQAVFELPGILAKVIETRRQVAWVPDQPAIAAS
jgi:hypothetical protein